MSSHLVIKRIWTCHLLCKRPRCYHSASNTQVAERIFKFSPIHSSVIPWIHWISDPFRENSNIKKISSMGSNIVLTQGRASFQKKFLFKVVLKIPMLCTIMWESRLLIPFIGIKINQNVKGQIHYFEWLIFYFHAFYWSIRAQNLWNFNLHLFVWQKCRCDS